MARNDTTDVTLPGPSLPWHALDADRLRRELGTTDGGLSSIEAAGRLQHCGRNEIEQKKAISAAMFFLAQFKNLLVWILLAAALISAALGEVIDCVSILAIVLLNASIGFYQEFNAERSVAALKRMTAPQARVRRDGVVHSIPASTIVPGDVMELRPGDLVAADARLIQSSSLKCMEAPLTGEAIPAEKRAVTLEEESVALGDRCNMVFLGTNIATGEGTAIVVTTGMHTEIGRIAGLIEQTPEEVTPLQLKLERFGRVLVWAALGIVGLLFVLGLFRGIGGFEMFLTSISLAVAAVPEGLPAVVTIALALGVARMSRRRALVRKLPAVETLGSTTVICTDKTGTLTLGEMTVRKLYVAGKNYDVTGEGYEPDGEIYFEGKNPGETHAAALLEIATGLIGCNNAHLILEEGTWKVMGDPTEGALLAAGHKAGLSRERVERELPKHHEIPFDSDRKRRTVIRRMPGGQLRAFVNGAPDVLLQHSTRLLGPRNVVPISAQDRERIVSENAQMAKQALRVIGSAYRDIDEGANLTSDTVERDLVFVGLAGMYDPPRAEAKEAVAKCYQAGIRVVMITGDHPNTAGAIARELGIAREITTISGTALDQMSDQELARRAPELSVYARVTAEHKLRIVRAWQSNGAVVAMTGDGVNDAPAIKGADIGIAMGRTGTEVTKEASDIIITDDNFASIVAAVEQGRGIYDNIRKTLQYLLAGNTGELLLMTVCIVSGLPSPLLPIHLLWINLVTDGLPALCLATDPVDAEVMQRKPRSRSEPILDRAFLKTMLITGLLSGGVAFAVYLYALRTESETLARTHAFAALVFAELLRSFGARSPKPVWRVRLFSNLNLVFVIGFSIALQFLIHGSDALSRIMKISSLSVFSCLMLLFVSSIPFLLLELFKLKRAKPRS